MTTDSSLTKKEDHVDESNGALTVTNDAETELNRDSGQMISDSSASEKQPEDDEGDDGPGLHVDRGWAWVILAGAVFESIIYGVVMKSLGIIFVEIQKRFHSSASQTSLVTSIQNIVISCGALILLTLVLEKVSARKVVILGTITYSTGSIITAFATDVRVLYFSFGVVGGTGVAMMFYPVIAMVNQYFKKHRGLANGLMTSGMSLGGLVSAPAITALFEEYGYSGTNIIIAGIFLHVLLTGAVLRPLEAPGKDRRSGSKRRYHQLSKPHHQLGDSKANHHTGDNLLQETGSMTTTDKPEGALRRDHQDESELEESPFLQSLTFPDKTGQSHMQIASETSQDSGRRVSDVLVPSIACHVSGDAGPVPSEDHHERPREVSGTLKAPGRFQVWISDVFKRVTDRDSVIRNPVLLLFLGMQLFTVPGVNLVYVYLAPYANDLGIPMKKIALLYTIAGALDFVSRMSVGFISDRKWIRHNTLIGLSAIIIGTLSNLIRFFTTYPMLVAFAVIMGIFGGTCNALRNAVLADLMDPKQFKTALGCSGLMVGAGAAIGLAITGALRGSTPGVDVTLTPSLPENCRLQLSVICFKVKRLLRDASDTYVVPFHLLGVLAYVGGAMSLALPLVNKRREQKRGQRQSNLTKTYDVHISK